MSPLIFPSPTSSVFILVDVQQKLLLAMPSDMIPSLLQKQKLLLQTATELKIPVIVTEQYPQGLGPTVTNLTALFEPEWPIIEKTSFSCFGSVEFRQELRKKKYSDIILLGMESHICIQQTALAARQHGFSQIWVIEDAVCSRHQTDCQTALNLLRQSGIHLSTAESIMFMLLLDLRHPSFKKLSSLLK